MTGRVDGHDSRALLDILDAERRATGEQGDGVVREWSPDRTACRIVYADVPPGRAAGMVEDERRRAADGDYEVEWKVYSHDPAAGALAAALTGTGFEADDTEAVLVLDLDEVGPGGFALPGEDVEIRTVSDGAGLRDVAQISTLLGRSDVAAETSRLAGLLADGTVSIHVAYLAEEPVSCGRLHYGVTASVAELAGGRTVPAHRNCGLFTAVVRHRLDEAVAARRRWVFVDALPTSEPILTGRGFVAVTETRPYLWESAR